MVYGSCRHRKDVLSCITSQHWKCRKSVTLLCRLVLQFFPCLVSVHIKIRLPIHIFNRKNKTIFRSRGLFHRQLESTYSAVALFPTYKLHGDLSSFFLSINSLEYFFTTFRFQGISGLNFITSLFPVHSECKHGDSIYIAWYRWCHITCSPLADQSCPQWLQYQGIWMWIRQLE